MTKQPKKCNLYPILTNVLIAVLGIWVMIGSLPTGWIYDLTSKNEGNVGKKPDSSVQQLLSASTLNNIQQWKDVPFTITSDTFVFAPLAKLRDPDFEGIHRTNRRTGYKEMNFEMYTQLRYPTSFISKAIYSFGLSGTYNNYYLVQLEDDTYICAFFDNYHMIKTIFGQSLELPTGYIRFAERDERSMLQKVSQGYDINTEVVLDMYDHEKISWIVDMLLRLGFLFVGVTIVFGVKEFFRKQFTKRP